MLYCATQYLRSEGGNACSYYEHTFLGRPTALTQLANNQMQKMGKCDIFLPWILARF
jgi:hypothetical protein